MCIFRQLPILILLIILTFGGCFSSDEESSVEGRLPQAPTEKQATTQSKNPETESFALLRSAAQLFSENNEREALSKVSTAKGLIEEIPDGEPKLNAADLLTRTLLDAGKLELAKETASEFKVPYISSLMLAQVGHAHWSASLPGDAKQLLEQATKRAEGESRAAFRATSLTVVGQTYLQIGDEDTATILFERADQQLGYLEQVKELHEVGAIFAVATSLAMIGRKERAIELTERLDSETKATLRARIQSF